MKSFCILSMLCPCTAYQNILMSVEYIDAVFTICQIIVVYVLTLLI